MKIGGVWYICTQRHATSRKFMILPLITTLIIIVIASLTLCFAVQMLPGDAAHAP